MAKHMMFFSCPKCKRRLRPEGEVKILGKSGFVAYSCSDCTDLMTEFQGEKVDPPMKVPFNFVVGPDGKWFQPELEE